MTVDDLRAYAASVGWSVEPADGGQVVTGGLADGTRFTIEAWLYDDVAATPDRLEWRSGALTLDRLLVALTNERRSDRAWVRRVQLPWPGLASARAEGSDGVILDFERTSVEVELPLADGSRPLTALAESEDVARRARASDLGLHAARALAHATGFPGFSLEAFAGVPFCRAFLETRHATPEALAGLAHLGEQLHALSLAGRG